MDSENRPIYELFLNIIYKNICFVCVKETSLRDDSFICTKHMFDRIIIIWGGGGGGGYIFLCPPPYNSAFYYFEIKSLVTKTSN